MAERPYYVYILTNRSGTLYVGMTIDLGRRTQEHQQKLIDGFTKTYNITQLVYYEITEDAYAAVSRERQIKGWLRRKKVALIEASNPSWRDLSSDWEAQVRVRPPAPPGPSAAASG